MLWSIALSLSQQTQIDNFEGSAMNQMNVIQPERKSMAQLNRHMTAFVGCLRMLARCEAQSKMNTKSSQYKMKLTPNVQSLVHVVGGGKQAKYGIAKQGQVWLVEFYLGRHSCLEGLLGSTQKRLLANGALVKLGGPILR